MHGKIIENIWSLIDSIWINRSKSKLGAITLQRKKKNDPEKNIKSKNKKNIKVTTPIFW